MRKCSASKKVMTKTEGWGTSHSLSIKEKLFGWGEGGAEIAQATYRKGNSLKRKGGGRFKDRNEKTSDEDGAKRGSYGG